MLLLDTGDALVGGGYLGDQTQGQVIVEAMNLVGYDAMALGPKELSLGQDLLRQRLAEAAFPMLSANVTLGASKEGTASAEDAFAPPYAILDAGGRRVAIIGLTRAPDEPLPGFEVLDPVEAAARYVPEVAEQADLVVVLTNQRYRSALALAGEVPGIDLVVAALPGQLPSSVARAPGSGTMVVSAEQPLPKHTGRRVGVLLLDEGPEGDLYEVSWTIRALDKQLADDPEMRALLDRYRNH